MIAAEFSSALTHVTRIAGLFDESTLSLVAARRRRAGERVTRSRPRNTSVDFEVLEARTDITQILDSWANLVTHERAVRGPSTRDVGGLTTFLAGHIDWLATHPAASDFAEEMAELADRAAAAVDADRHALPARACPAAGCEGSLTVVGEGENPSLDCEFGHSWDSGQWLALTTTPARSDIPGGQPRTVPTNVAAIALKVSEATIRQWVRRGKLTRYGPAHRAEFDIEELAAMVAAHPPARTG
ncbi:helix-turn-helix domain-containing protein [Nocardia jejuensis]|uniref:helix-turn-helix domain-containing protein n=1 Tax=Nocardia jejuensis TaxID=328049 RepID=UPI000AFEB050|nr:helix-turn-helix domain-containing protein [Nocardia jejuensis]